MITESPYRINIKDMTIGVPKEKKSRAFLPERDITEDQQEMIKQYIQSLLENKAIVVDISYLANLKTLLPEQFKKIGKEKTRSRIDSDLMRVYGYLIDHMPSPFDVNYSQVEQVEGIKLVLGSDVEFKSYDWMSFRPELMELMEIAENSTRHFINNLTTVRGYRVIKPNVIKDIPLKEELKLKTKEHFEWVKSQSNIAHYYEAMEVMYSLRIISPSSFPEIVDKDIITTFQSHMLNNVIDSPQYLVSSLRYYNELAVVSADGIKVTNNGIKMINNNSQPQANDKIPERRRF
jgi:hypothetical protein